MTYEAFGPWLKNMRLLTHLSADTLPDSHEPAIAFCFQLACGSEGRVLYSREARTIAFRGLGREQEECLTEIMQRTHARENHPLWQQRQARPAVITPETAVDWLTAVGIAPMPLARRGAPAARHGGGLVAPAPPRPRSRSRTRRIAAPQRARSPTPPRSPTPEPPAPQFPEFADEVDARVGHDRPGALADSTEGSPGTDHMRHGRLTEESRQLLASNPALFDFLGFDRTSNRNSCLVCEVGPREDAAGRVCERRAFATVAHCETQAHLSSMRALPEREFLASLKRGILAARLLGVAQFARVCELRQYKKPGELCDAAGLLTRVAAATLAHGRVAAAGEE